ncbi:MAG: prepilin-type N-terminal cleavage/methylation domain-containing protein [Bacilli bacterium]|nr:prepilin-type N-terminal cleavage/methylation domain-containing protein [Bacilli bacterium]
MKKGNGFTLVELLAALVIIGLIISITIPTVLGILRDTEKETKRLDGEAIIDNINNQLYSLQIKKVKTDGTYAISKGVITNSDIFKYKISKDYDGEIVVTKEKKISLTLSDGKYCIKKGLDQDKVTIEKYDESNCTYTKIYYDPCYGFDRDTGILYAYGPQPIINFTINKENCLLKIGDGMNISNPEEIEKLCNGSFAKSDYMGTISIKSYILFMNKFMPSTISSTLMDSGIISNYSIKNSTATCQTNNLEIPKQIFEKDVKIISSLAFASSVGMIPLEMSLLSGTITIPNTVTTIETHAFYFNDLTKVIFEPNSQINEIGELAFAKTSIQMDDPTLGNIELFSNKNLSQIIYTGTTPQDWNSILSEETTGTPFVTGTVTNVLGDVTISAN